MGTRRRPRQARRRPRKLVQLKEPPTRFGCGADAVQTFETKAKTPPADANADHELSTSLANEDGSQRCRPGNSESNYALHPTR